jgi:predicted nuclease of predicted toxin-antitoxin system
MKLLLDECLPDDLKDLISGHEVLTVSDMGWKRIKNGELMKRVAENELEVFLTVD